MDTVTMSRETTDYVYFGVTGTAPTTADVAFLPVNARPQSGDWNTATLVTSDSDPLWADAVASGVTGTYFVAIRVGEFSGGTIALVPREWFCFLRLTGDTTQVVVPAPKTLTVV